MPERLQVFCAVLASIVFVVLRLISRRELRPRDLFGMCISFFTAATLPIACILCRYGFDPDLLGVAMKLRGYEEYITSAGMVLLGVCLFTLAGCFTKALARPRSRAVGETLREERKIG